MWPRRRRVVQLMRRKTGYLPSSPAFNNNSSVILARAWNVLTLVKRILRSIDFNKIEIMRRERTEEKIEETSSLLNLFLSDSIGTRLISCIVFDRFVFIIVGHCVTLKRSSFFQIIVSFSSQLDEYYGSELVPMNFTINNKNTGGRRRLSVLEIVRGEE